MTNNTQETKNYWDNIFNTRDYTQVFWHQESPDISLGLIDIYAKKESSILDVGCGTSFLVENLIKQGYTDISLLDASEVSLNIVKTRLENDSNIPKYICSDITNFKNNKKFDIWHDRAVFHFLLLEDDREKYFKVLQDTLKLDGTALISTFRVGGDISCAGLPIVQYDEIKMMSELPAGLKIVKYNEFLHKTPKNTFQDYCSFIIKKIY